MSKSNEYELAQGITKEDILYEAEECRDENPLEGMNLTDEDWNVVADFLIDDFDFAHARVECVGRVIDFIVERKNSVAKTSTEPTPLV